METVGWMSLLPPLIAITLAIWSKQVFLSLFIGIWSGWSILAGGNPLAGLRDALEACVAVFADGGNTKVIIFTALVGALIAYTQRSGGVEGFINWVAGRGLVRNRRQAGLMAYLIGIVVFVESNITCLVTGTVARPVFDKLKISREKLAYICDSTSAPVCMMLPLNGWGAFTIGLLQAQDIQAPFATLIKSLPYNFYAIFALLILLISILTGKDIGPMRRAEKRAREEGKVLRDGAQPVVSNEVLTLQSKSGIPRRARNLLVPVAVMVLMMPVSLLITGQGNLMRGSGSTAVFWAVSAALVVAAVMYSKQKIMKAKELTDLALNGMGGMAPLALLMVFAFALGATCKQLGTGPYVANAAKAWLSPGFVPAVLFLVSGFVAFSTGTSWGTFAIMIPIGVPMVSLVGADLYITVGAVLSGGVFGDHCSPISDTTIVASMASASDHIDHVRTQLPYALLAAGIALALYLLTGI